MSERRLSPEVIAGILEDYRAGMSPDEIASERGVSKSSVHRAVKNGGPALESVKTGRTWGPCEVCGKRCRGWVNFRCSLHAQRRNSPDGPIALTGGRWIPKGGIMVWDGERPTDEVTEKPARPPAQCGTDSGYHRHIKVTKTPACDLCKEAHRVAQRESAAVKARQQRGSAA